MRTLADLEALADHIGKLETAGDHSAAAVYWDLFNDAVAEMTVDQLRAAVKQLLVARSDSSVRLASAPRGIFSRRLVGSDG
jgi:plasmid stabilization system protein ParE